MCVPLSPLECIRNGSGLHRVYRGGDRDARVSSVGRALLRHALQPRPVLHVRQSGGCPHTSTRPEHGAEVDAQRTLHWY